MASSRPQEAVRYTYADYQAYEGAGTVESSVLPGCVIDLGMVFPVDAE